jgi:dephospho-CoA kinase
MTVVGLTGPMGSGKSVVLQVLRELGAETLRADDASRELLATDECLLHEIQARLGSGVFRPDGTLDRRQTASLIFADPQARAQLEAIMHPPMVRWLARRLEELRQRRCPPKLVVLEAAILNHMGARGLVESVVRVWAPREECLRRLQERDGLPPEEAVARMSIHDRLGLFDESADYVLDTSGSLEQTKSRTVAWFHQLMG